jgi:hypothetical protein
MLGIYVACKIKNSGAEPKFVFYNWNNMVFMLFHKRSALDSRSYKLRLLIAAAS